MKEYNKEGIRLINGDCLEVMDYLIEQGVKVDAKDRDVFDVQDQLDSVAQIVVSQTNGLITDVEVVRENEEENVLNYFYDHFPALIQDADYNEIRSKINSDSTFLACIN